MDRKSFIYVRAAGAIVCIITLNALVLLAFLDAEVETPKWSIYVLMFLIGAFLGLDAIVNATPIGPGYDVDGERTSRRNSSPSDPAEYLDQLDEEELERELEERSNNGGN